MVKALERIPEQEIKECLGCGEEYDLTERFRVTRRVPIPNTAHKYCSNECWVIETASQDYA